MFVMLLIMCFVRDLIFQYLSCHQIGGKVASNLPNLLSTEESILFALYFYGDGALL